MNTYAITTDTTADLPEQYIRDYKLGILSLSYTIEDKTYDRLHPLPVDEFYAKMRAGSLPTTSQVSPELAKDVLEPILKSGKDVLHIAFSSGLSGTFNSCRIAASELAETYPDRKIIVIDSLCASLGEGLLVYKAIQNRENGLSLEENAKWVEEHKLNIVHNFTVDDLNHLYRGGRVSKTAAVLGTMINIKPILHVDDTGHLVALSKVRGRKKSLNALVDSMEQQVGSYRDQNDIVFISHGDAYDDAVYVAKQIKKKFQIENFVINYVGSTIGAHSGPGTIALFYLGDRR